MSKRKNRDVRPERPAERAAGAPSRRLSAKFVATSMAATLNITAAMLGFAFPHAFPALAAMPVMVTLLGVGIGLEWWAIRQLMAARRGEIEAAQRR